MTTTHTPGTGPFDGATWDGKRWTIDGQQVKVGAWQNTSRPWQIVIVGILATFTVGSAALMLVLFP